MKKSLIVALLALSAAATAKEDPKTILDTAVDRLENAGGIRGQFTITQFDGTKKPARHTDTYPCRESATR